MESDEQERKKARAELDAKIRAGYDQLKRGETLGPEEVFNEIREMSKAARKAADIRIAGSRG